MVRASLDNSKQCKEDFLQGFPEIHMYISNVVAAALILCSSAAAMTEVIWICYFVKKRTLTLVCFAVRCCYHKTDKNNQVDVNII